MTRKQRAFATLTAGLMASTGAGCVSCKHEAFATSLKAYKQTGIPAPVRQRVFLFILNGADITDSAGLCNLRDRVCEAGFSKVYFAQRMDANWYEREVRRVVLEEPSARVVLLGVGSAADKILPLAAGATDDGVPVDAVVLLDPCGVGEIPHCEAYRTVVVRSRAWKVNPGAKAAENIVVDKTGHLSLATCPAVVELVVGQMIASAGKVAALPGDPAPQFSHLDRPVPTPRPLDPTAVIGAPDGWNFLLTPPTLVQLPIPVINGPPVVPADPPAPANSAPLPAPSPVSPAPAGDEK